jgi:carboxyl-terminal processing protease
LPGPDRSYKIGVIEIPAFYGADVQGNVQTSTTKDVQELIEKLKSKGVEGIILDIRYNGGGLLDEAVSLTGLFVKTAPVLQVKDSFGQLSEFIDQNDFIAWNGPLIVFVSRYSASASEILAGALKDQNRALLVGDPTTHGKGTVQAILEVDRSFFHRFKKIKMGAVKITIQKWYRPSGESTQLKGVPSDIVLPSINPFLQIGESDLPQALAWDQIHALPWIEPDDYGLTNSLKASLKTKSAHRHNTLPELQLLQKSVDWLAEKQQQKSFSLNLEKRRQERQATILYQQALETELESLGARTPYPSEKILLDAALAIENEKYTNPNTVSNLLNEDDALDHNSQASSTDLHLHEALRIMSDWIGYY